MYNLGARNKPLKSGSGIQNKEKTEKKGKASSSLNY